MHLAVLERQGECGLTFEVEMLLTTDLERAREGMGRGGERGVRVALGVDARAVFETAVGGECRVDGEDRLLGRDRNISAARGGAGGVVAGGDHQKERLARVVHAVRREQGLIVVRRGDVIGERQIGGGQDGDHARRVPDRVEVHAGEGAMRHGAQAEGEMQSAGGRGDIVDVARSTRDMQMRGIMGQGPVRCSWPHRLQVGSDARGGVMRAQQHVLCRLHPVGRRGAHIRERREVLRERRHRGVHGGAGRGLAAQGGLGCLPRGQGCPTCPRRQAAHRRTGRLPRAGSGSRRRRRCPDRNASRVCSSAACRAGPGS